MSMTVEEQVNRFHKLFMKANRNIGPKDMGVTPIVCPGISNSLCFNTRLGEVLLICNNNQAEFPGVRICYHSTRLQGFITAFAVDESPLELLLKGDIIGVVNDKLETAKMYLENIAGEAK